MRDYRLIPLTQGKSALVDTADYGRLAIYKWNYNKGYAVRNTPRDASGKQRKIHMHREVAGTPEGMYTDHINGNGIDNRRSNLRICTIAENSRNAKTPFTNKSGYRGVVWAKESRKWQANIRRGGPTIHLGLFANAYDAAQAYNFAVYMYHGEFARYNHPLPAQSGDLDA